MAKVDGIHELRFSFPVDNNTVVCQAYKDASTKISLITPHDNWKKELVITANAVFGYSLACGDHDGHPMKGLNKENKQNTVDLGHGSSKIAIQFLKAKALGEMTNYGTMDLPASVHGYHIIFFWPKDAPGDAWNIFINDLKSVQHAVEQVQGISDNVVQTGENAKQLAGMFK